VYVKFCIKIGKISSETLAIIEASFSDDTIGHARVF
jgi:hypothetical protein